MSKLKHTRETIIQKFINIHGLRYSYDKVNYKSYRDKVSIGCLIHGYFEQSVSNHISGHGCPKCKTEYLISLRKLTTETFITKAKLIHGDKYSYDKVIYTDSYTPAIVSCSIHGDFLTTPNAHLQGNNCIKCKYDKLGDLRRLSKEEFIKRANAVHMSRFSYESLNYKSMMDKVTVTCPVHGDFEQTPVSHLSGSGCPSCNSSRGEHCIENILNKNNIKFIREYILPNQNNKFRYDFYLPDINIIIEFHGIQHYKYVPFFHNNDPEKFSRQKLTDCIKKDIAKTLNIPLIEFNYKQLTHLSIENFELLVSEKILKAASLT